MDALRPNRAFTDRTAVDAPSPPSSPGAASPSPVSASPVSEGALLRVLLAGAVALLVMLLPAQLAASGGAAIHLADRFEIIHHRSC